MAELPEHALKTIADFQLKLEELVAASNKVKTSINQVCAMYDVEPMYDLADDLTVAETKAAASYNVRPDEFFGKPFSTCVREILNARKARELGPADPKEVYEILRKGGFAFDAKDEEAAFRGMQISISKNTATFVRLPSGQIGLEEWYDRARRPKAPARVAVPALTPSSTGGSWPIPPPPPQIPPPPTVGNGWPIPPKDPT